MSRRHLTFACGGATLVGSLDVGDRPSGLLIVSGGNEIRSGAFAGQTLLAAKITAAGYPVFRFDRRGVGDSEGENGGFRSSAEDVAAAVAAFRAACPGLRRVVGFGNCDAASALMLSGGAGLDGLVLANPWSFDAEDEATPPPPQAIRARYAARLRDPREWWRLLRGGVDLGKLARGLAAAARPAPPPSGLVAEMRAGLGQFQGNVRILLADRDRTAQAFDASWPSDDARLRHRTGADHAFSAAADRAWLLAELLAALDEQARQLDMG